MNAEVGPLKWRYYFVHLTASTGCEISTAREKNFVEFFLMD